MSPGLILSIFIVYCLASREVDSTAFFATNRQSPGYLATLGMIGTFFSGITFFPVPGNADNTGFGYFQVAPGYPDITAKRPIKYTV